MSAEPVGISIAAEGEAGQIRSAETPASGGPEGSTWAYRCQPEGQCAHCRRQVPVLELGAGLRLCSGCLRQGANLLDLREENDLGQPWTFEVYTDYHAGPVTWEDVCDVHGHFLFTLYALGGPLEETEPQAGAYDRPGYYPSGYPVPWERDGYPEIVSEAKVLGLDQVETACRQWMAVHGLPAGEPLVINNGSDEFQFASPGSLPTVTHYKPFYSEEEDQEEAREYPLGCLACGVQILSYEPQMARCPWCGVEMGTNA